MATSVSQGRETPPVPSRWSGSSRGAQTSPEPFDRSGPDSASRTMHGARRSRRGSQPRSDAEETVASRRERSTWSAVDPKGEADRLGHDPPGDHLGEVDLERPRDAVPRDVLEFRADHQAIIARAPRNAGRPSPDRLLAGHRDPARQGLTGSLMDRDQAVEQRPVHRLGEADLQGIAGLGPRRTDAPGLGIRRGLVRLPGPERLAKALLEGTPRRVGPLAVHDQLVRLAGLEDRAVLLARLEPALDPARVEQQGEARPIAGPELFVEFQEGRVHRLAGRVD